MRLNFKKKKKKPKQKLYMHWKPREYVCKNKGNRINRNNVTKRI